MADRLALALMPLGYVGLGWLAHSRGYYGWSLAFFVLGAATASYVGARFYIGGPRG